MAIKVNKDAYDHAVSIIKNGLEVENDTNNWDEVKPTPNELVRFLDTHTLEEYGLWFLGINSELDPKDKSKYVYPVGDLNVLHQSALELAVQQSAKNTDHEVKRAAEELLDMVKRMAPKQ